MKRSRDGLDALFVAIALAFIAFAASAKPFIPSDDGIVLERLPEKNDPALKALRRERASLAARPDDLERATAVARAAIDASRATGDPRFLGQAQAALAPWWSAQAPPAIALLLRATVKQSQHDFAGALADLDRLLASKPGDGQARITRATVHTVMGHYDAAQADCARLASMVTPLIATTCLAGPASLRGNAGAAYRALVLALARSTDPSDVRAWATTLAAEIAARRSDRGAADSDFRQARTLDPRDPYTKAAYADFLLDDDRANDVRIMLADDEKNDALLLRLTLAERRLPEHRQAFERHRAELTDRFAAARARGDALHRREEARFRLEIENDATAALALARDNWNVQREPADLRILAAAARAANDAASVRIVDDWIAANALEDARLLSWADRKP